MSYSSKLSLVVLLSASTLLSACFHKSGGSGSVTESTCGASELLTVTKTCVKYQTPDVDRDGTPDGIDLNGDLTPELVTVGEYVGYIELDINGDAQGEYFLVRRFSKSFLFGNPSAHGTPFLLVLNAQGEITGLDTDGDGELDDPRIGDLFSDSSPPSTTASLAEGRYADEQTLTVNCTDNKLCDAIAYTLDGSEPNFTGNGKVIFGSQGEITLSKTSTKTQHLKYRSRDRSGNVEGVQLANFSIGCDSIPVASITEGARKLVAIGSQFTLSGADSKTSDGYTIQHYRWRQLDTHLNDDITTGVDMQQSEVALPAPTQVSTLRFQLEIEDSSACRAADTIQVLVLEDPSNALFVDGDNGVDDTNRGSVDKPLRTLNAALLAALSGKDLYVKGSTNGQVYDESSATLLIPANVSLYGGFSADWSLQNGSLRSVLLGAPNSVNFANIGGQNVTLRNFDIRSADSTQSDEHVVSVRLQGSNGSAVVTLQNNIITAGDVNQSVSETPGSSYGLHASLLQQISLKQNRIYAGSGGRGKNGVVAVAPAKAANGNNADDSIAGAASAGDATTAGTKGGNGSTYDYIGDDAGDNGDSKLCYSQVLAGGAGRSGNGDAGNRGSNGANGIDATKGGKGIASLNSLGFFNFDQGVSGSDGLSGCGGTGGGGGGYSGLKGGGGGGGGAGGQGGIGGTPGINGGASIGVALYLVNNAVLQFNNIYSANGGTGGLGAAGSNGGQGGDGGKGDYKVELLIKGKQGGDGGAGGNGGRGGNASGGGGGASIGVLLGQDVAATLNNNAIISAEGGAGGAGGSASGASAAQGERGYSYSVYAVDTANPPLLETNLLQHGNSNTSGSQLGAKNW